MRALVFRFCLSAYTTGDSSHDRSRKDVRGYNWRRACGVLVVYVGDRGRSLPPRVHLFDVLSRKHRCRSNLRHHNNVLKDSRSSHAFSKTVDMPLLPSFLPSKPRPSRCYPIQCTEPLVAKSTTARRHHAASVNGANTSAIQQEEHNDSVRWH